MIKVHKRLLHVNGWWENLRLDTGAACNIMYVNMRKKLGIPVENREQLLVVFNGDTRKTIGVTQVVTRLGEWSHKLEFHITSG